MTNFKALKKQAPPVPLSDEQIDELIATNNGELIYWFAFTARVSVYGLEKLQAVTLRFQIVPRDKKEKTND